MRLLSIDVETTGLDPNTCGIIEFGAVLFEPKTILVNGERRDKRWQFFECLVDNNTIQGEPYALSMNAGILAEIAGRKPAKMPKLKAASIALRLRDWLLQHGVSEDNRVTIVGKNYCAFDEKFLSRLPGWNIHVRPLCHRRVLDVGSLYFDPTQDERVPSLEECLNRVGINTEVKHRALDDACDVATSVTRLFN